MNLSNQHKATLSHQGILLNGNHFEQISNDFPMKNNTKGTRFILFLASIPRYNYTFKSQ